MTLKRACSQHILITVGDYDRTGDLCGKPARYQTPSGRYVCGTHRRVVDAFLERQGKKERCVSIQTGG